MRCSSNPTKYKYLYNRKGFHAEAAARGRWKTINFIHPGTHIINLLFSYAFHGLSRRERYEVARAERDEECVVMRRDC